MQISCLGKECRTTGCHRLVQDPNEVGQCVVDVVCGVEEEVCWGCDMGSGGFCHEGGDLQELCEETVTVALVGTGQENCLRESFGNENAVIELQAWVGRDVGHEAQQS